MGVCFHSLKLNILLDTGILALENHGPLSSLNCFGKQHMNKYNEWNCQVLLL